MRSIPAHWIRENKAARIPHRLIVIDTEARSERTSTGERQSWRCGVASFTHWTAKGYRHGRIQGFSLPRTLWDAVADFTRPKQRTVLYAHNLPYDMRIARALIELPALGFRLDAIRVASQGSWSRWSRNGATLTLCDSASIFPVTVYTLGQFLGMRKLPFPEEDDDGAWMDRCWRDVEITTTTMVEYFEWLRTGVAGNWQLTGAGQSWSHWRHAHYTHQVLVHADSEALAAERRAMWTGRAENWQWGRDHEIPVYEWDWQNAYPRIARDTTIPTRLAYSARQVSIPDLKTLMDRFIVLADVTVTTDLPIVPARHNDRILWPVGTFDTTLWQPELQLLLAAGATVRVHRAWMYHHEPALRSWAAWVLGELHGPDAPQHRWRGVLLKHWSRALIGRFATQYQDWELFAQDTESKVTLGRMHDTDTGETHDFMQVGHEIHIMTGLSESDDSCPQITSYVTSVGRAKLWKAMVFVGLENVFYVDTDSIVVNMEGNTILRRMTRAGKFDGLRLKGRHRGYEIYGPRAAIIGPDTKFAGIPRNAHRVSDTRFEGEVWTQFARALRVGEIDTVTIARRPFAVRWNEHRRARTSTGRTTAYQLPEYRPSEPVGRIEPVTDAEITAYIRHEFNGKNAAAHSNDSRNGGVIAAHYHGGIVPSSSIPVR